MRRNAHISLSKHINLVCSYIYGQRAFDRSIPFITTITTSSLFQQSSFLYINTYHVFRQIHKHEGAWFDLNYITSTACIYIKIHINPYSGFCSVHRHSWPTLSQMERRADFGSVSGTRQMSKWWYGVCSGVIRRNPRLKFGSPFGKLLGCWYLEAATGIAATESKRLGLSSPWGRLPARNQKWVQVEIVRGLLKKRELGPDGNVTAVRIWGDIWYHNK